jgi:hypothetical protein
VAPECWRFMQAGSCIPVGPGLADSSAADSTVPGLTGAALASAQPLTTRLSHWPCRHARGHDDCAGGRRERDGCGKGHREQVTIHTVGKHMLLQAGDRDVWRGVQMVCY